MQELIKGKVQLLEESAGRILDSEQNFICKVRGWGRIQKMDNSIEKFEALGKWIADAINEKLEREELQFLVPRGQILIVGQNQDLGEIAKRIAISPDLNPLPDFPIIEDVKIPRQPPNPRSKKQGKGKHFTKRFNQ